MLSTKTTEITHEVPFHDVDSLNVVWHGNYAKYFELGCTALLRAHDLDYPSLHALGYVLFVVEVRCRYSFPLAYADQFRVRSRLKEIDNCILIASEIYNLTQKRRSARARTTLAITDSNGELLLKTPDEIRSRFTS